MCCIVAQFIEESGRRADLITWISVAVETSRVSTVREEAFITWKEADSAGWGPSSLNRDRPGPPGLFASISSMQG